VARLSVEGVTKRFGNFAALDGVTIAVDDGEFVAILGASGSGKTTLLRQIAGFDRLDAGCISIGDDVVSSLDRHVPPERRRIGIVFQSYALWPHMSVAENVAYGLDVGGVKGAERQRRVAAALDLVDLGGLADRSPAMLSGGQRQRVALARCLVTEPSLVLLDEPLANLDVHLRAAMEDEFARFHARTGTTMIYITHDQSEAMALADRIAVMDHGRVLQFDTPSTLWREPANDIVARFIGDGVLLPVDVVAVNGSGDCDVEVGGYRTRMRCAPGQRPGRADVCLRATDVALERANAAGIAARIERAVYQGGAFRLDARPMACDDVVLRLQAPEPLEAPVGSTANLRFVDGWVVPAD
jgi:iron(III) transport system ATP-binding protein